MEREIRRDAQFQAELETGTTGVFALLNKRIGDESEAAKILKKAEQRHSDGLKPSEGSKFEPSERAGTQNTGSSRKTLMTAQVSPLDSADGICFSSAAASQETESRLLYALCIFLDSRLPLQSKSPLKGQDSQR